MNRQARAPNTSSLPSAIRLDLALSNLTAVIAELVRLSAENRPAAASQIEVLRTRRHQLSAVIDGLTRFAKPDT